jgi:hypothetical protein
VLPNERALRKVQGCTKAKVVAATLESAQGTAWGLLNAVTEYVDHERRARSTNTAWTLPGSAGARSKNAH